MSAGHDQTATILNRHGDVISRWNSLLGASGSRKQRLLRMQDQFRQIEELYLTFAKKASAFNSWFENAEEDLTDPVRCNSIEEIRALREAHAQFQVQFFLILAVRFFFYDLNPKDYKKLISNDHCGTFGK